MDIISCPPGTPIKEICSLSCVAEFPGTRTGYSSSWHAVDSQTKLVGHWEPVGPTPAQYWPALTESLSVYSTDLMLHAVTSCLLKMSSLSLCERPLNFLFLVSSHPCAFHLSWSYNSGPDKPAEPAWPSGLGERKGRKASPGHRNSDTAGLAGLAFVRG